MIVWIFFGYLLTASLAQNTSIDEYDDYPEKILYGEQADIRQYSYMVALISVMSETNYHFVCGGSIVTPYWVLTAAHCTASFNGAGGYINAGSSHWNVRGSLHQMASYVNHPQYRYFVQNNRAIPYANDIALIRVTTPFDSRLRRVELPPWNFPWITGVVTGWGMTATQTVSPALMKTRAQLIDTRVCMQMLGSFEPRGMVCIKHASSYTASSVCPGDSGSPLVANGVQVGLVSRGSMPCTAGNPVLYTDVRVYSNWILGTTRR